jgi:S1-C subfamily serine protease
MGSVVYLQKGGDLITGIDDQPVTTFDDILVYLESYKSPGDQVQLRIMRPGQGEGVLTVTLGERPKLTQ